MKQDTHTIKNLIIEKAKEIGFVDVKFISVQPLIESEKNFLKWRESGLAGDMNYLLRDNPKNARPNELVPKARTIILLVSNYYSPVPPRPSLDHGRVASYAVGMDYHKVIKKKIKLVVENVENEISKKDSNKDIFKQSRFFTDAVPLLEKSFAIKSGLGFRGKNTLLISRENGSYNFIAEILTDIEFEPDCDYEEYKDIGVLSSPHKQKIDLESKEFKTKSLEKYLELKKENPNIGLCGSCTRCASICPTDALIDEYKIDARLCISYLTIEYKGEIPIELKPKIGEWLFGCDLCQDVCPYNKKFVNGKHIKPSFEEFDPSRGAGHWVYLPELIRMDPISHEENIQDGLFEKEIKEIIKRKDLREKFSELINLSNKKLTFNKLDQDLETNKIIIREFYDSIFHSRYSHTPLTRPKREGLIRNAKIVLANKNN